MPSLKWRLENLTNAPADARADLLLAALAHCNSDESEPIARAALTSGSPEAVAAAVRLLDRHPGLYDALVPLDRQMLAAGLRIVFFRGSSHSSLLAIGLVRRLCDPRLAMELLHPLEKGDDAVQSAAAKAIVEMTLDLAGRNGRRTMPIKTAKALDELICATMNSYETHRSQEVVYAAAIVHGRKNTKLREMLSVAGTPQRLAVQGVPHHTNESLVRENVLNWLDSDLLGRQAARYLDTLEDPNALADVLRDAHLLMTPARRKMMANAEHAVRCLPDVADAVNLPVRAQQWLPRYISALPISAARQTNYLADLIALPAPAARWRAIDLLMRHRTDAALEAVRYFARDQNPSVAIAPATHVLNDTINLRATELRSLSQCRHRSIAARAGLQFASQNAEQFAEMATKLSRHAMIVAARELCATSRSALVLQLTRMLQHNDRNICLAAIFVTRRLNLSRELENQLLTLLQSDDAQRCSAAASALGDFATQPRIEILTQLLDHDHARVRANAVEAIGHSAQSMESNRRAATIVEVIAPHADSRANRERANALVAWIRAGNSPRISDEKKAGVEIDVFAAVEQLKSMLRDDDPLHRVSAIWAAGRSNRIEVVNALELLAKSESVGPVRERAVRTLRRVKTISARD